MDSTAACFIGALKPVVACAASACAACCEDGRSSLELRPFRTSACRSMRGQAGTFERAKPETA
eukprot:5462620-Alexandrium_andersonii.AAC.1